MDAEVASMPENARHGVDVDYTVTVDQLPDLLVRILEEPLPPKADVMKDEHTKKEIEVAAGANALEKGFYNFGELSLFTCPECHGVLSRLQNDKIVRYRCHTGHACSIDTLMAALTERIEDGLYNAIRGIDESIMLLNRLGDHYAEGNHPKLAGLYFNKAKEAAEKDCMVRKAALSHEQLSQEFLRQE